MNTNDTVEPGGNRRRRDDVLELGEAVGYIKNFGKRSGKDMAVTEKTTQVAMIGIGLLMALVGGAFKTAAVLAEPGAFSADFFSGADYILLCAGLALVVLALGHDRLFGPDGPENQR